MRKTEGYFLCRACGGKQKLWSARCRKCGVVGAFTHEVGEAESETVIEEPFPEEVDMSIPVAAGDITPPECERISTKLDGLDAVLGGGLPREILSDGRRRGTSILLWGRKGAGKTRLAIMMLSGPARRSGPSGAKYKTLYITGEETPDRVSRYIHDLKASKRIAACGTTDINVAMDRAQSYDIVVLDSAQTFSDPKHKGGLGSRGQMDLVVHRVLELTRTTGTIVILLSQVTASGAAKGGAVSGHITDVSLYMAKNGESRRTVRIDGKNRFGPVDVSWRCDFDGFSFKNREKRVVQQFDGEGQYAAR